MDSGEFFLSLREELEGEVGFGGWYCGGFVMVWVVWGLSAGFGNCCGEGGIIWLGKVGWIGWYWVWIELENYNIIDVIIWTTS